MFYGGAMLRIRIRLCFVIISDYLYFVLTGRLALYMVSIMFLARYLTDRLPVALSLSFIATPRETLLLYLLYIILYLFYSVSTNR